MLAALAEHGHEKIGGAVRNQMLLDKWKKDYDGLSHEEQKKYRDADIRVINLQTINDSVTSYTYANTYKLDTTTIKVIRVNGNWQVDLKEILKGKGGF